MKVSDYIVMFLIEKNITDVFGYPGGMVTHLMESLSKYSEQINAHTNYHEQASAFSACGYAQASMKPGVAYATSGPGATNLITGICNAYFDSIPTIFITGQVNTFESKEELSVRQRGFQETNIIEMVSGVTKYCQYVKSPEDIRYCLEKAYFEACDGRPGPVLLDIPMNIQRSEIDIQVLKGFEVEKHTESDTKTHVIKILNELNISKNPCILIGAGVKISDSVELINEIAEGTGMPIVSSMLAFDVLPKNMQNNYGFIGSYGSRAGNFILSKSDLIIAIGTRLDIRQIGSQKEKFATKAKLIRIDIDKGELANRIKEDEIQINTNIKPLLKELIKSVSQINVNTSWTAICNKLRDELEMMDDKLPNLLIRKISKFIPDNITITTDVGQNQVWIAQSFEVKKNQKVLFTGGHGAMGYSLPAAIGAYYATKKPVVSMNGDGGLMMNIQELQFVAREQLPITIILYNNKALGMIRHFQEMYFNANYTQTTTKMGYETPDFEKIALSYGFSYYKIMNQNDIVADIFEAKGPSFIEVVLDELTYVYPKLEYGKPNQDQEPLIERELYEKLDKL